MEFRLLVALLLVFTCSELAKAKLKGDDCEGTVYPHTLRYRLGLYEMLDFFFVQYVSVF